MKKYLLFIACAIMICSCGNSTPKNQSDDDSSVKSDAPVAAPAVKGKYAVKSGIVVSKGNMMGMNAVQTLYFDDFGASEAIYTSMEMMGTTITSVSVTKEGWTYNFNPKDKTGTKSYASAGKGNLDFENLTDEVIKEYNIKKIGSETVLGKECDKYSMNSPSMNIKGEYCVWKGIALKMNVDMSSIKMIFEATSVQEDVAVQADKFVIPADIVFK